LKRLNQELSDKDRLFIYYNQKFEGLEGNALHKKIHEEWQKVLVCFRTLQDWYNDPEIYNYVGYLSQCGVEISAIYHHYVMMDDTEERDDFIRYLKEQVKYTPTWGESSAF
jgi:dTDP-4-amino-4,6-dideoxygalactose transaminase